MTAILLTMTNSTDFHLEDKVKVMMGGIVRPNIRFTHFRRPKISLR